MSTFQAELAGSAARLLHFGMSGEDFRAAAAEVASWDGWSHQVEAQARHYQAGADRAFAEGRVPSAAGGWRRSAVYHHFAQLRAAEPGRRCELRRRSREAFSRAAPHLSPPAYEIEHGYLRVARPGAPCVLLLNGLDTSKEVELASFAEGLLQRGCSVFFFDGPGQGARAGESSLAQLEPAVAALLDMLSGDEWLGPVPFGIFGPSHGGHLACRVAAREPRLQACVSLGGFHDASAEELRRAYRLAPDAPLAELEGAITLEGSRGQLRAPLLVVHETADPLVDPEQVRRLVAWAAPAQAEVWSLDRAEQLGGPRFGERLPRVWDWMAGKLAGRT